MALSKVAIANRALQKLGATRVESLSQDHKNARSMNAAFDQVRDAELRRYTWSFAIKRASIAEDGDGPEWGDWNRYSQPNDFLRVIRDNETGISVDWKPEGLFILSRDASPLELKYVARIEDPNYYDPLFVDAFASKLAFETCREITGSTSAKESAKDDYNTAIAEAKRVGSIEKDIEEFPEDEWVLARL